MASKTNPLHEEQKLRLSEDMGDCARFARTITNIIKSLTISDIASETTYTRLFAPLHEEQKFGLSEHGE